MQRFFTQSEFDHVAMVLRLDNNEVFLFEATSNVGVNLLSWDLFMKSKCYSAYSQIAFRHNSMTRSSFKMRILEEFIEVSFLLLEGNERTSLSPQYFIDNSIGLKSKLEFKS